MKYDLVFEGGGAKGIVFVGACEELCRRGHSFDLLLGTSAGAITATLLTAGYTPEELLEALTEKEGGKSVTA
jgi:NTE family protein